MLSLRSEAEDFPQSSAQARPTTPSAARSKVPSALGEAVHRQLCGWQNYRANTVVSV